MSKVRVLVGTRKGAFVLTSDGKREKWDVSGPHFAGWELYHLKGSPADPNRLYASQCSGWFGQLIQRSDDGGKTWTQPGTPPGERTTPEGAPKGESNKFVYDTSAETGKPLTTHQFYDGKQHPWEFKRVWHLEPSLSDPDTVYAGVEDAALFRSKDGGKSWQELSGLRGHGTGPKWQPGAGGLCLHTIILDPKDPGRIYIAISAAGAFRTDDAGKTWRPINKGLHSQYIPDPNAEIGHCVHHVAMHRSRPNVLFMQKHWDVMRSDSAEVQLDIKGPVTQRSVLDALEDQYPMLRGTIRDHVTQERRPFLRFFACEEDYSLEPPDTPLPDAVASGKEPLLIIGAIAGG